MCSILKNRVAKYLAVLVLFVFFLPAAAYSNTLKEGLYAQFDTSKGKIVAQLFYKQVPITCINFVGLAQGTIPSNQGTKKYYDGTIFHRVIDGFMIQGGDPTGTGRGGPGYKFMDEFVKGLKHDSAGILSMANAGKNTNGSQFFITHTATPHLDGKHSVFGRVVDGLDVVNKIKKGDTLDHLTIIRVGQEAKAFKADKQSFDAAIQKVQSKALALEKQKERRDLARFQSQMQISYPDAVTTDSGLMYVVNKEGVGQPPKPGNRLVVHYTGMFTNKKVFNSSVERNEPYEFNVGMGQAIKGWDIAFLTMKKGEKRTLLIPYSLAFGKQGVPGTIPPETDVIFEVELIDFQ